MKFIASLALVLAMVCPHIGSAQPSLNEQDVEFLDRVAQASMLEIQASQLALQSAGEPGVKQYAQQMLIDHEKIAGDLQGLASTHAVKLPTQLNDKFRDILAHLQQERGTEFDRRYIDDVAIGAHEDAIKYSRQIAHTTQSQDINTFADKSVRVLQQHLDRAKNIAKHRKAEHTDE